MAHTSQTVMDTMGPFVCDAHIYVLPTKVVDKKHWTDTQQNQSQ